MKISLLTFSLLLLAASLFAQSGEEAAIRKQMAAQVSAWNRGDLDAFMKTYWPNDSLMFIGHGGITYGYDNTLRNYKKNYDTRDKMGTLSFDLLQLKRLSPDSYFVVGKFFLKRTVGDASGYFTLLFRKIQGHWLIICDHTS